MKDKEVKEKEDKVTEQKNVSTENIKSKANDKIEVPNEHERILEAYRERIDKLGSGL